MTNKEWVQLCRHAKNKGNYHKLIRYLVYSVKTSNYFQEKTIPQKINIIIQLHVFSIVWEMYEKLFDEVKSKGKDI